MKLKNINTVLTLTANIGVLIGLILVLIELRQNDDNLNASIQLSLSSAYENLATLAIEQPHFQQSLLRAYTNPEAMTVEDTMFVMSWQYRYLVVLHTTYQLRNAGIVSDEVWREKVGHFTVSLTYPAMYDLYLGSAQHDEFFSRSFYDEIEAILAEQKATVAPRNQQ